MTENTMPAALVDKFDVQDHGRSWLLYCKKCRQGWELIKASSHPGNVLHLLNHAASHRDEGRAS